MGIETTKALQARRREAAAHMERLIARADKRSPIGSARRARVKQVARLARRRVKALTAAQEAVASIEVEVGLALLRVVEQGVSRNESFELAGLSRHLGRRYVALALGAQGEVPSAQSTAAASGRATASASGDLGHSDVHPGATTPEGEL
jgi:hypothetical protein